MDDVRIGRLCRAIRRRLGLTQAQLAAKVGCHQTLISRLERGQVASISFGTIRRVFLALGATFDGRVTWRGSDLDRLLDERHAATIEAVARVLASDGWLVLPEVTYSEYREQGSIDLVGAHAVARAIAVFEIKTDVPRVEETVRKHDEKTRIAPRLMARRFGWQPRLVGRILVMPDESRLRRIVDRHRVTFRSAYPAGSREVRAWLRAPSGPLAGLWFLSVKHGALDTRGGGGSRRVRQRPSGVARA